ncbi:MAG: peptide chain release factor N(5)-glutamine methyltransferase, partial [Zoogloea sp.]|nr:peptide chain release factor N(5)-glutamine methyltransferase [Zoogloea sp.]
MADLPATVGAALAAARGRIPASEARLFLREILGVSAARIAAYPEDALTPAQAERFADLLARRAAGEPVAYLLGVREFY